MAEEKNTKQADGHSNTKRPGIAKDNIITRLYRWSRHHFFLTFITLYIFAVIFAAFHYEIVSAVIWALLLAYIIISLITGIHRNITKLLHHELKFSELLIGYITSVLFLIILFTILYLAMPGLGLGNLQYGSCIDNKGITAASIKNNPLRVTSTFQTAYYSAITFFTVGYGDICSMGWDKLVSVANALIGSLINVVILAIAITNYSTSKNNNKKRKRR